MNESGSNKIDAKGCKYLSRMSIAHIEWIGMGNKKLIKGGNRIQTEGVNHLIKAVWRNLEGLWLCNKFNIKGEIALVIKESLPSSKSIGENFIK